MNLLLFPLPLGGEGSPLAAFLPAGADRVRGLRSEDGMRIPWRRLNRGIPSLACAYCHLPTSCGGDKWTTLPAGKRNELSTVWRLYEFATTAAGRTLGLPRPERSSILVSILTLKCKWKCLRMTLRGSKSWSLLRTMGNVLRSPTRNPVGTNIRCFRRPLLG